MTDTPEKLKKWTNKDIILNVLVYLLNITFIIGLFIVGVYIKSVADDFSEEEVLGNADTIFHFVVLLVITFAIMGCYLFFEDRDFLKNAANSEMLFLILELSLIICFTSGLYINDYFKPLALVALLIMFLYNRRTAIFMNFIFCIIIFLFEMFTGAINNFEQHPTLLLNYLIMGFSSGLVATFVLFNINARVKVLIRSVVISVPTLLCITAVLAEFGEDSIAESLIYGFFSGPFAVVCMFVLLPVLETLFRRVSCYKYGELTDHKSKLIRRLITNAPGTFNHSIVVANIAEACASAIGEDPVFARTCAYYHDMGKLRRPEFFKENQANGSNLHDDLTPELSTNIIKSHTLDGYNLVLKYGLPRDIANVCLEHHGTMPIIYFYDKAKKFTDGEVDIKKYCYQGPKPQSKISAIIMIADGCEAAARTLTDRTRDNVYKTVRKVVDDRMKLGQFDECEITFKELNIIVHTVVNNLSGIYHNRIEYPTVDIEEIDKDLDGE